MDQILLALHEVATEMEELKMNLTKTQELQATMHKVAGTFDSLHTALAIQRSCFAAETIFRASAPSSKLCPVKRNDFLQKATERRLTSYKYKQ